MGNSLCRPCDNTITPLEILVAITGVISMICCTMIIVTYFRWRHLQTTTRKLLVYLSVADYTFAACNVIGALRDENGPCNATVPARDGRILSVFGTLGSCCSYFWTVFLAVYLYIMIVKNNSYLAERIFPLFHIIGWGVPVIVIGLATYMDVLGCSQEEEITGGWCWVILQGKDNRGINVMWMLVTAKLWELLAYFVIFILYFKIKFHFKREKQKPGQLLTRASYASAQYLDRKLTFIPIAFILLRMWGTIRFFLYAADPDYISCDKGYIKYTGWLIYIQVRKIHLKDRHSG
jgi:G protein-coupled receptor 157